jgi:hypothetical protein
VDEDGPEDGSLRLEVVRQRAIDCNRFSHANPESPIPTP